MNYSLDRLNRQKEELEALIKSYQGTTPHKDLIEWRILNENEEVDNLYVQNKTLFINDNMMILKDINGGLQKWEIKKIYPIDKKDQRINELEAEIKKLKEVLNEHTEPISTIRERNKSNANDDEYVEYEPETSNKYVSRENQTRTSRTNSQNM